MFRKFLKWMETRDPPLTLRTVTAYELRKFLDYQQDTHKKKMTSLIRLRYLRLLERVYTRLELLADNNPDQVRNPAREVAKEIETAAKGRDKAKVYLSDAQQELFMEKLPKSKPFDPKENDASWKKRRDRAMLATMLGAGLKVSEVIKLKTRDVGSLEVDGSLTIDVSESESGLTQAHRTTVRPFAVPAILEWIEERKVRNIPHGYLFPPSLTGSGAISSNAGIPLKLRIENAKMLDKATVYRKAQAVFKAAGIEIDRKGGRTLRNTFAVSGLAEGKSLSEVKEQLGHRSIESTQKYSIEKRRYIRKNKGNVATVAAGNE